MSLARAHGDGLGGRRNDCPLALCYNGRHKCGQVMSIDAVGIHY